MIDEFELKNMERLHKKLTPGPWRFYAHTGAGCEGLCYCIFAGENEFACFDERTDAEFAIWMSETLPDLISGLREAWVKNKKLETENSDLKRQVTEAISYILSNEGASMIDCRTCFFVSSCEREPQQCGPDYEMCLRAVRKYIEDSGE